MKLKDVCSSIKNLINQNKNKVFEEVLKYYPIMSDSCKFVDALKIFQETFDLELDQKPYYNIYYIGGDTFSQKHAVEIKNIIKQRLISDYTKKTKRFISDFKVFEEISDSDALATEIRKASIIFYNIEYLRIFVKGEKGSKEMNKDLLSLKINFTKVFVNSFKNLVDQIIDINTGVNLPVCSCRHFDILLNLDLSDTDDLIQDAYISAVSVYKLQNKI